MKLDELNDWLTVLTNIGVMVGLAILVYEIRQTNVALDQERTAQASEIYASGVAEWGAFSTRIIESREVADLWIRGRAGEPLDEIDVVRFDSLVRDWYRLNRMGYEQWSRWGESADWQIHNYTVPPVKKYPGIRSYVLERLYRENSDFTNRIRELYPELLTQYGVEEDEPR